jgi:uncharacterized protein DUF4058
MPSPFPGMDPYLEGNLWPDVHQRLATKISQLLTPKLRPRYVARLKISVVEDESAEAEIRRRSRPEAIIARIAIPFSIGVRLVSVEVRDVARNRVISTIEIISPVNRREPGMTRYREKRLRLHRDGIHLIEIDLLRRGTRPFHHPRLSEASYAAALTRSHAETTDVWPVGMKDVLPVVPVPLSAPDPDVTLDLGHALAAIYDEAAYDLSIDYWDSPPPPPLPPDLAAWVKERVSAR